MDNCVGRNAFELKRRFFVHPFLDPAIYLGVVLQRCLSDPSFQAVSSFVEKWAEMGDRGE